MVFPFFEFTTSKDLFYNNGMHLTKHFKEGFDYIKNVNIPYNIFIESVICEAPFYILYIKILLLKTVLL